MDLLELFTQLTNDNFTQQQITRRRMQGYAEFSGVLKGTTLRVVCRYNLTGHGTWESRTRAAAFRLDRLAAYHRYLKDAAK
jgi:hypothetical protein